ncbi:MAG: cyclase family protein [Nitrososphaeria archaeon]|jgi:kynurenine formamidase
MVKLYDLSQPLNADFPFWPLYPPFEVKYIKRKSEHGVNAQYIMTSNHIGTHLDAPRHFITNGKTIDQIPLEQLYGTGVVVDVTEAGELGLITPEMVESKIEVKERDIIVFYTGWVKYAWYQPTADEEKYTLLHPGMGRDMVEWMIKKKIKWFGVDTPSPDHPMNLPLGRFLPRASDKIRRLSEQKFGGPEAIKKLFPEEDYQLMHNALFPYDIVHVEHIGGQIEELLHGRKAIRTTLGAFPWLFKGGEAAFCRVVAFVEE